MQLALYTLGTLQNHYFPNIYIYINFTDIKLPTEQFYKYIIRNKKQSEPVTIIEGREKANDRGMSHFTEYSKQIAENFNAHKILCHAK